MTPMLDMGGSGDDVAMVVERRWRGSVSVWLDTKKRKTREIGARNFNRQFLTRSPLIGLKFGQHIHLIWFFILNGGDFDWSSVEGEIGHRQQPPVLGILHLLHLIL
ncbi:hypothetical protein PIB30_047243 [Stylosanthes scabra]|uniref:Uncharacterized protein n=1 Tax=Stylosanthes scabra TaxID=79078 RepID=A0ABU6YFJ1_9FABA|nr:hypothetical protein [Stylosanthes scabra]